MTEVWTPLGLVTFYILFFIHVSSRQVYFGGITTNPNKSWMKQAARNLIMPGCSLIAKCRYLIRDRDTKFRSAFDMIFRTVGIEPLALPPRSPNLYAFAKRFVRSIKICIHGTDDFFRRSIAKTCRDQIHRALPFRATTPWHR